jgi:hypothetical protein
LNSKCFDSGKRDIMETPNVTVCCRWAVGECQCCEWDHWSVWKRDQSESEVVKVM